jgi:FlaG/FlaF family flagellin (archaellin)
MNREFEDAVSPVVGVMLMLVVVIIIAAVVSGFAGSLVGTDTKPPQATIQGEYSASTGITRMFHAGGDTLPTQDLFIQVYANDEDFAGYTGTMGSLTLNRSRVYNSAGAPWLSLASTGATGSTYGTATVPVWRSGEVMWTNETSGKWKSEDVGKSIIIEVSNGKGKLISKSKVVIDP